jgi:hypothetical protein
LRWAEHVVLIGEITNGCKILVRNMKGIDHLEELGVDGRIILELILGKQDGKVWTEFIWLRVGTINGILRTWS